MDNTDWHDVLIFFYRNCHTRAADVQLRLSTHLSFDATDKGDRPPAETYVVRLLTHSTILLHAGGSPIVMNTQLVRMVTMMNKLNKV